MVALASTLIHLMEKCKHPYICCIPANDWPILNVVARGNDPNTMEGMYRVGARWIFRMLPTFFEP